MKKVKKFFRYIKTRGLRYTLIITFGYFRRRLLGNPRYSRYIAREDNSVTTELAYRPLISIVVPVYNVSEFHLVSCIESVLSQTCDNYELVLADDNSSWDCVKEVLSRYSDHDRIKVIYRTTNGHISQCTNTAIEHAEGEYIAFMDCDDTLSINAIYEITAKLNEREYDFVYSDEDKLSDNGKVRFDPLFKPDWSPDTLNSIMYTGHLGVYRAELVRQVGMLRDEFVGSQDHEFTLRFVDSTTSDKIGHVNKILYHWRARPQSVATGVGAKPYAIKASYMAKVDTIARRQLNAEAQFIDSIEQTRIVYNTTRAISIVIHTKDNYKALQRCIDSIELQNIDVPVNIILLDSSIVNKTVSSARYPITTITVEQSVNITECYNRVTNMCSDTILYLSDNSRLMKVNAIQLLAGHAQQSHTGAVGGKVIHGGFIVNCGTVNLPNKQGYALRGAHSLEIGYLLKGAIEHNCMGVSSSCLCVDKSKLMQIGGWQEDLSIDIADMELCTRLYNSGLFNVTRADVVIDYNGKVGKMNYPQHNWLNNGQDDFYSELLDHLRLDYTLKRF